LRNSEARPPLLPRAEPGSVAHAEIFLKGPLELRQVPRKDVDEKDRTGHGRSRIRCPRCAWEPGREDRWMCTCLHMWNTFETRGVCPACGREWKETQCRRCSAWSPHEDWYVDDSEPSA